MTRLVRPHIPLSVRLEVIARQLQADRKLMAVLTVSALTMKNSERLRYMLEKMFGDHKVHLDHDPPLCLREIVDAERGLYRPDANDPKFLVYRTAEQHYEKTFVRNGADFSDAAKRRRAIKQKRKASEPIRPSRWPPKGSRKIASRPFIKVVR